MLEEEEESVQNCTTLGYNRDEFFIFSGVSQGKIRERRESFVWGSTGGVRRPKVGVRLRRTVSKCTKNGTKVWGCRSTSDL